jgi:hypothetical protein
VRGEGSLSPPPACVSRLFPYTGNPEKVEEIDS